MRKAFVLTTFMVLCALCLPLLGLGQQREQEKESPKSSVSTPAPTEQAEQGGDASWSLKVSVQGQVQETTMAAYLPGVVAGEMPAAFPAEALKAQAVAARTYILYKQNHQSQSHPDAVVCDDPACCKAYQSPEALRGIWGDNYDSYRKKVSAAVTETDGLYLSYGGDPIQAVFHASSAGKTEASGAIWNQLPYLVSVSSPETPETVENLLSQVAVSPEDFRETVLALEPNVQLGDDPAGWLGETHLTEGERVDSMEIGGVAISGGKLRTAFSLRSTKFTLAYTEGEFVFQVSGYGHGVGMSQYGAKLMAESGSDFAEILSHYYPGTQLEQRG